MERIERLIKKLNDLEEEHEKTSMELNNAIYNDGEKHCKVIWNYTIADMFSGATLDVVYSDDADFINNVKFSLEINKRRCWFDANGKILREPQVLDMRYMDFIKCNLPVTIEGIKLEKLYKLMDAVIHDA